MESKFCMILFACMEYKLHCCWSLMFDIKVSQTRKLTVVKTIYIKKGKANVKSAGKIMMGSCYADVGNKCVTIYWGFFTCPEHKCQHISHYDVAEIEKWYLLFYSMLHIFCFEYPFAAMPSYLSKWWKRWLINLLKKAKSSKSSTVNWKMQRIKDFP